LNNNINYYIKVGKVSCAKGLRKSLPGLFGECGTALSS